MDADITIHLGRVEGLTGSVAFDLVIESTGTASLRVLALDPKRPSHAVYLRLGERQCAVLKNAIHKLDGALEDAAVRGVRLAP